MEFILFSRFNKKAQAYPLSKAVKTILNVISTLSFRFMENVADVEHKFSIANRLISRPTYIL